MPRPPILDRQAQRTVVILLAVGSYRKDVAGKEFRHGLFVVIMHLHRAVDPGDRCPGGCLGLDQNQRKAIDQQDQIGPSLGTAGTIGELLADDIVVLVERICEAVKVDQSHRHMLVVLAERHRTFAPQPGCEFLVGTNQAIGTDRKDDGAQFVEHLVGQFWIGGNFRVEANQRVAHPGLDQHFLRLAGDVGAATRCQPRPAWLRP
jgi:hypothetical protein